MECARRTAGDRPARRSRRTRCGRTTPALRWRELRPVGPGNRDQGGTLRRRRVALKIHEIDVALCCAQAESQTAVERRGDAVCRHVEVFRPRKSCRDRGVVRRVVDPLRCRIERLQKPRQLLGVSKRRAHGEHLLDGAREQLRLRRDYSTEPLRRGEAVPRLADAETVDEPGPQAVDHQRRRNCDEPHVAIGMHPGRSEPVSPTTAP